MVSFAYDTIVLLATEFGMQTSPVLFFWAVDARLRTYVHGTVLHHAISSMIIIVIIAPLVSLTTLTCRPLFILYISWYIFFAIALRITQNSHCLRHNFTFSVLSLAGQAGEASLPKFTTKLKLKKLHAPKILFWRKRLENRGWCRDGRSIVYTADVGGPLTAVSLRAFHARMVCMRVVGVFRWRRPPFDLAALLTAPPPDFPETRQGRLPRKHNSAGGLNKLAGRDSLFLSATSGWPKK